MVRIYSCGPTVYDHIHIGNLSSFIAADTLRRVLMVQGYKVHHVMNFTDVDDKTIKRSQEKYPDLDPKDALKKLTDEYIEIFKKDMEAVGCDLDAIEFVRATDCIEEMKKLIVELHEKGFAYTADDGIYFSIEKYRASGKKYGQLVELTTQNTSQERINNDEYDKDSAHDFTLWKKKKDGEPAWEFNIAGQDMSGRPGWHIECSVMSRLKLGQPFDIHTGGIDLAFPHHENEIAQSTAAADDSVYAHFFVHNEHLLVGGKKMSKSLNNFYTLEDITNKGFDPLAFRLMVLQAHYRSQLNFTWESLEASENRLKSFKNMSEKRFQADSGGPRMSDNYHDQESAIVDSMLNDLDTASTLRHIAISVDDSQNYRIQPEQVIEFTSLLNAIDSLLGLNLLGVTDIQPDQKHALTLRAAARDNKNWEESDRLRTLLHNQGIEINDTDYGQVWSRV